MKLTPEERQNGWDRPINTSPPMRDGKGHSESYTEPARKIEPEKKKVMS